MLTKFWGTYDRIFKKTERFGVELLLMLLLMSPIVLLSQTNPLAKITGAVYICTLLLTRMLYVIRKKARKVEV
jgi:hypothetical protein